MGNEDKVLVNNIGTHQEMLPARARGRRSVMSLFCLPRCENGDTRPQASDLPPSSSEIGHLAAGKAKP
ncbi:hypothetical protein E4U27_005723 [Claviceps purpurea]|nr:hypothetical protein E4U27_005723 [Claviceps purpurea]